MAYTSLADIKARTIQDGECWLWPTKSKLGYGDIYLGNYISETAHRLSYRFAKGEIPEDLCIDHLCRKPSCVNPDHLEAVTIKENTLRGVGMGAINAKKTLCIRGHNRWGKQEKGRRCLECHRVKESFRRMQSLTH